MVNNNLIERMDGYDRITKPPNHTWRSFCNLLLQTMPKKTREHYIYRFRKFIYGWHQRGYKTIPDEAPPELEAKCWAPSWRRMCKVLLRKAFETYPESSAYHSPPVYGKLPANNTAGRKVCLTGLKNIGFRYYLGCLVRL